MKIIGNTKDGFILTATSREVAHLIGYYYENSDSKVSNMKSGDEVNVSAMFQQLYSFERVRRQATEIQKQLRDMATSLDKVAPIVPAVETK